MGSTTVQARFGEQKYSIGRFVLDRARALGISRTELVLRLGYRDVGNGHRALGELLRTGTVPPLIAKHLADALQADEAIVAAVMATTARQQQDEASQRTLAREAAYQTAFKPHLRCETNRVIPEPIFVAALLGTARLRLVSVPDETWQVSADERDRHLKRAIQDHREHGGYVPAFGAVVGYAAVVLAGYLLDFGLRFDRNGDPIGQQMQPVERLGEAVLGTKRGDSRLTGFFRDTPIGILG